MPGLGPALQAGGGWRIRTIVVSFKDRLTRFGFEYLRRYFASHGASIVVVRQPATRSAKRVSGAWLASWQVHWFFSQVQARATLLARLAGIAVELVDARGTSKRCSACNTTGIRKGKTFSCTNKFCKKVMDSDLNASRNVRIAPVSPRLHTKGEGARYRPIACVV